MSNLEIKAEVSRIQSMYRDDPKQTTFNALVVGEPGNGKTFLVRTCRFPVHIDSFDPGGTKGLRDLIDQGKVVVDSRWESEDPLNPSQYEAWKVEMVKRVKSGYFNYFGTYVLDSLTTWSDAIMNRVLQKAGIAGQTPRFTHDYQPQKQEIKNMIRGCLDLPCDFIMTAHLRLVEDPSKGKSYVVLTTGDLKAKLPGLFDEMYTMRTKETARGIEYQLLTKPDGLFPARSRLASVDKLNAIETPNIKNILTKCGLSTADKECF